MKSSGDLLFFDLPFLVELLASFLVRFPMGLLTMMEEACHRKCIMY